MVSAFDVSQEHQIPGVESAEKGAAGNRGVRRTQWQLLSFFVGASWIEKWDRVTKSNISRNLWKTYGKLMEKIRFVLNIGKTPEEAPHGLEDHFPIIRWADLGIQPAMGIEVSQQTWGCNFFVTLW